MKNNKIEKQIIIFFVATIVINAIIMLGWLFFRTIPVLKELDSFKNNIYEELNKEYSSIDELKINLDNLLKEKDMIYSIKESNTTNKEGIVFFSGFTKIENETYFIDFISVNSINVSDLIKEACIFQIGIVSLLFIIIYLLGRYKIIMPVESIMKDIKNYKFGRKTKRKKFDSEFGVIQNEFVNLTEELEKEKKEQNRIIASISHDIKTPLTSIIGYADLIDSEENIESIKKYNNKISVKALHIKDVLSSFDDYLANYEKTSLKLSKVLISDIVKELNNDYKIELENNNIKFEVNTKLNNEEIEVDLLKLKRIFSNLISNSIRYVNEDGKISINISKDKNNYIFIVSDNGKGINEEIIDRIFDPFYTTDKSRKISGLGLAICKEFVEMHKGTIKAYNDNGFVIRFTIPK